MEWSLVPLIILHVVGVVEPSPSKSKCTPKQKGTYSRDVEQKGMYTYSRDVEHKKTEQTQNVKKTQT